MSIKLKQVFSLMLALVFLLALLPGNVFAADIIASGYCGGDVGSELQYYDGDNFYSNLIWTLHSDGRMVISGSGRMAERGLFPWYPYKDSIKSVTIEYGATSVGWAAFLECSALKSVAIPDSVTKIDMTAFYSCSALESVTIPDSVTEIGQSAFEKCTSLKNVDLGKGLARVYGMVFKNCTSLESIEIPGSLTTIGNMMFLGCSSLREVKLGSGVETISTNVFDNTSLETITIPRSVTCIQDTAFASIHTQLTVRYEGTRSEWNAIDIGIYNSALSDAIVYCNGRRIINTPTVTVPDGKYCIRVVDEEGNPISDAAVTWDGESKTTGSDGIATFDAFTIGEPLITVKKSGYRDWSNANSDWSKNDEHLDTVILYSMESTPYKLSWARYSKYADMSHPTELLIQTKKLSLSNDGNLVWDMGAGEFYLRCSAVEVSNVRRYELWQKENRIAQSTDGNFGRLSVDDFSKGGGCFIRVIANDGTKVDTHINLRFVENQINPETQFSLDSQGLSIEIGDYIPFIGGSKFEFNLPINSPLTFLISDDKVQVGVNVNLAGGESPEKQLKATRDLIRKARRASSLNFGKNMSEKDKKIYESLIGKKHNASFFKNGEINFLGYLEGDFGSSTVKGNFMLQFKLDAFSYEFNTIVVVVPVTVQVKIGIEGDIIAEISYDWENATVKGAVDVDFLLKLKAFGGVGVSKLVGVGAYGDAKLKLSTHLITPPVYLKSAELTGELGLKAYVGPLERSRAFAHNTWYLYTADSVSSGAKRAALPGWDEGITDASGYTLQDLSYLSEESVWLGEFGGMKRGTASGSAKTQFTNLLTDTYRNARPVMVSDGEALYAAFVRAEQESGSRYVAVTKYDGASWLAPVQADGEAILDDAPVLCVGEDGTIWLAYARTADDPGDSLLAYAQSQQIVVGTVDPDTLAFTEAAVYGGSGFAHLQKLSVLDGQPVLMWADTELTDDDSVLSPVGGAIRYSVYASGAWSGAAALTEFSGAVADLTPGFVDGAISVAYVSGGALYCTSGTESELLAEENVGRVSFDLLPGAEAAEYFWNGDGCLLTSSGEAITAEGITQEYAVIGSRIYYSMPTEGSANLAVIQYADENWGLPMLLTGDSRYLENLSAASLNGTDYVFGMHTAVTIAENSVEDAKNLVWSTVMPVSDLRLDSVEYEMNGLTVGEYIPLTLNVINVGDHTVDSIAVSLGGRVIHTEDVNLLPGQSVDLTLDDALTCPSSLQAYAFSVSEPDEDDYSPEDNSYTLSVGYADAEVELDCLEIGDSKTLVAYVTNRGIEIASGKVVFYDAAGEVAASCCFEDLAAGDVMVASCEMDEDFIGRDGGDLSVVVTIAGEEFDTFNNSATINLSEAYIVSFDSNGGSGEMRPQYFEPEQPGELRENAFTRVGYTFAGWNTEADGSGDDYADEEIVTPAGNLTLYAQWEAPVTAIRSVDNITVDGSPAIIASIYCTAMSATAFAARYGADGRFLGLETMVLESGDNEFTVLRQGAATVRFFLIDTVTWAPLCEPADAPQE